MATALRRAGLIAARPLGAALERSRTLFLGAYHGLGLLPSLRRSQPCPLPPDPQVRAQIDRVAADLRRDGFARWDGLFRQEEFLTRAREELRRNLALAETALEGHPPGETVHDRARMWMMARDEGRTRVMVLSEPGAERPASVAQVMESQVLRGVAEAYYQADARPLIVVQEGMGSDSESNHWHFDRILDQLKAMILLTDVGPENGPLEYLLGSHRERPAGFGFFLHMGYRHGPAWTYPPPLVALQGERRFGLGTGKAGDCLLFDTLGLHRGRRCLRGERLVLVSQYEVATTRNEVFRLLSGDRWV